MLGVVYPAVLAVYAAKHRFRPNVGAPWKAVRSRMNHGSLVVVVVSGCALIATSRTMRAFFPLASFGGGLGRGGPCRFSQLPRLFLAR